MRIMAVSAHHLSFFDGMVRRHRILSVDFGVAFVTDLRFIDGHRRPGLSLDIGMVDMDDLLDVRLWMRIVAIGARHAVIGVRR